MRKTGSIVDFKTQKVREACLSEFWTHASHIPLKWEWAKGWSSPGIQLLWDLEMGWERGVSCCATDEESGSITLVLPSSHPMRLQGEGWHGRGHLYKKATASDLSGLDEESWSQDSSPPPQKKKELYIFDSEKLVWHTALNALFPWRNLPLRAAKLWQNFTSPYRVWQVVNNASMLLLCIVQLGSAHDAEWKGGGGRERREQQEYSCILLQKAIYIFSWALSLSLSFSLVGFLMKVQFLSFHRNTSC